MQLQRLGDVDEATAACVVPAVERMEDKFKAGSKLMSRKGRSRAPPRPEMLPCRMGLA
jgi:hypothetical protein